MLHKPRPEGSSALRRSGGGGSGCKQLERVAGWVSTGIYTAFFTSLDRCACVKIDTIESNMQEPMISRSSAAMALSHSASLKLPRPPHSHEQLLACLNERHIHQDMRIM
ncbi:hypothetical protein KP509_17G017600 [Ceratopteris richardii]|uniref:Uncharacterized protein n=1 Tax=Ceratopteris richardii TaxID=49495 RepID=A0A8T2SWB0_CERRI|nr:hypothetical protein KP509_17G017600 [Ceratopteris richardii]